jgi:hypothetical protein
MNDEIMWARASLIMLTIALGFGIAYVVLSW